MHIIVHLRSLEYNSHVFALVLRNSVRKKLNNRSTYRCGEHGLRSPGGAVVCFTFFAIFVKTKDSFFNGYKKTLLQ